MQRKNKNSEQSIAVERVVNSGQTKPGRSSLSNDDDTVQQFHLEPSYEETPLYEQRMHPDDLKMGHEDASHSSRRYLTREEVLPEFSISNEGYKSDVINRQHGNDVIVTGNLHIESRDDPKSDDTARRLSYSHFRGADNAITEYGEPGVVNQNWSRSGKGIKPIQGRLYNGIDNSPSIIQESRMSAEATDDLYRNMTKILSDVRSKIALTLEFLKNQSGVAMTKSDIATSGHSDKKDMSIDDAEAVTESDDNAEAVTESDDNAEAVTESDDYENTILSLLHDIKALGTLHFSPETLRLLLREILSNRGKSIDRNKLVDVLMHYILPVSSDDDKISSVGTTSQEVSTSRVTTSQVPTTTGPDSVSTTAKLSTEFTSESNTNVRKAFNRLIDTNKVDTPGYEDENENSEDNTKRTSTTLQEYDEQLYNPVSYDEDEEKRKEYEEKKDDNDSYDQVDAENEYHKDNYYSIVDTDASDNAMYNDFERTVEFSDKDFESEQKASPYDDREDIGGNAQRKKRRILSSESEDLEKQDYVNLSRRLLVHEDVLPVDINENRGNHRRSAPEVDKFNVDMLSVSHKQSEMDQNDLADKVHRKLTASKMYVPIELDDEGRGISVTHKRPNKRPLTKQSSSHVTTSGVYNDEDYDSEENEIMQEHKQDEAFDKLLMKAAVHLEGDQVLDKLHKANMYLQGDQVIDKLLKTKIYLRGDETFDDLVLAKMYLPKSIDDFREKIGTSKQEDVDNENSFLDTFEGTTTLSQPTTRTLTPTPVTQYINQLNDFVESDDTLDSSVTIIGDTDFGFGSDTQSAEELSGDYEVASTVHGSESVEDLVGDHDDFVAATIHSTEFVDDLAGDYDYQLQRLREQVFGELLSAIMHDRNDTELVEDEDEVSARQENQIQTLDNLASGTLSESETPATTTTPASYYDGESVDGVFEGSEEQFLEEPFNQLISGSAEHRTANNNLDQTSLVSDVSPSSEELMSEGSVDYVYPFEYSTSTPATTTPSATSTLALYYNREDIEDVFDGLKDQFLQEHFDQLISSAEHPVANIPDRTSPLADDVSASSEDIMSEESWDYVYPSDYPASTPVTTTPSTSTSLEVRLHEETLNHFTRTIEYTASSVSAAYSTPPTQEYSTSATSTLTQDFAETSTSYSAYDEFEYGVGFHSAIPSKVYDGHGRSKDKVQSLTFNDVDVNIGNINNIVDAIGVADSDSGQDKNQLNSLVGDDTWYGDVDYELASHNEMESGNDIETNEAGNEAPESLTDLDINVKMKDKDLEKVNDILDQSQSNAKNIIIINQEDNGIHIDTNNIPSTLDNDNSPIGYPPSIHIATGTNDTHPAEHINIDINRHNMRHRDSVGNSPPNSDVQTRNEDEINIKHHEVNKYENTSRKPVNESGKKEQHDTTTRVINDRSRKYKTENGNKGQQVAIEAQGGDGDRPISITNVNNIQVPEIENQLPLKRHKGNSVQSSKEENRPYSRMNKDDAEFIQKMKLILEEEARQSHKSTHAHFEEPHFRDGNHKSRPSDRHPSRDGDVANRYPSRDGHVRNRHHPPRKGDRYNYKSTSFRPRKRLPPSPEYSEIDLEDHDDSEEADYYSWDSDNRRHQYQTPDREYRKNRRKQEFHQAGWCFHYLLFISKS